MHVTQFLTLNPLVIISHADNRSEYKQQQRNVNKCEIFVSVVFEFVGFVYILRVEKAVTIYST